MEYIATIIMPYFGKFPAWSDVYFYSASMNPSYKFIFYTDCNYTNYVGISNVEFKMISFESYLELARKKTGEDIKAINSYKLCDLRPMFGVIHEEDIIDTRFFGWSDMDVIYGDINKFYTRQLLEKFDVFSTHEHRLSGHFALLKNNNKYKYLYKNIYNLKPSLKNPHFVGLDEHGITNALLMSKLDKAIEKFGLGILSQISGSINKYRNSIYFFKEQYTTPFLTRPWTDGSIGKNQPSQWIYRDSKIICNSPSPTEHIYLHLMNFKSSRYRHDGSFAPWESQFTYDVDKDSIGDGVIIDNHGIRTGIP